MALAVTYQTRIEDLIGSLSDTDAISNALKDIAREIINILPPILLESMTDKITDPDGDGIALGGSSKIMYADKDGYEARQVHAKSRARYEDNNSLFKATTKSPVFYIYDDIGRVIPGGGDLYTIQYPRIAYDDDYQDYANSDVVIEEMEPLIVLGAAVRLRMLQLIDKRADFPDALAIQANPPDVPGITIPEIDTTNWTAPQYDVNVAAAEFAQLATLIDTEEDVELAMAKIQEISAIIQHALNEFNEVNTVYQAYIAKAAQDAQLVSAAESQDIQRYGAQIQVYQGDIQKEVTAFTSNLQMIGGEHSAMMQEMQALQAQYQFGLSTLTGAAQ